LIAISIAIYSLKIYYETDEINTKFAPSGGNITLFFPILSNNESYYNFTLGPFMKNYDLITNVIVIFIFNESIRYSTIIDNYSLCNFSIPSKIINDFNNSMVTLSIPEINESLKIKIEIGDVDYIRVEGLTFN